ncbi:hypothetical protein [Hymenobacter convexus]|uniref:hypothetical protein n=1 Tax=Hymenobacter sp. CA1UV-4 TaxID=3063782 RepID=UPI002712AE5A|nr:hypothetical protein [Hymenobacter sp. CA1UV-4]MDO7852049.1 hypothetical protein [Hymenobacter sp. CA1UV-4]
MRVIFPKFHLPLLLGALLLAAPQAMAQLAYSGPAGGVLMQKARQQQAAGDRAGAAATYQQAYLAYTSVDDSDGMTAALAGKKVAESGGVAPAARPAAPARQAAVARPAAVAPPAVGPMPVAGHMVGNKPVGLFFVTKSVLGNFRTMSYYFSPEGVAYENPLGLSAAELAATPAKSKGRYSVAGKTLSIAWTGYPKPEVDDMNMLGGGFSWSGGAIFSAVGPFRSASQLVGSFEGGTSTYASAMGQATVSKSLTFNADGTYRSGGVATVTSVTERSVAETGGSSANAGRWRLDGWLLTLTDAQGHTVRDVAYPVGDGKGKVTLFQFNGLAYSRQ